ncbi:MAG: hypothetical protein PHI49_11965 [Halothiobacillaceae bacterium]|jgi:hypothetical protein|nr:hypothetical protein [Halothiobacillaceae bacterium]MDY0050548.1 hypothetical protein [Halothiobacillaceae bacterium]
MNGYPAAFRWWLHGTLALLFTSGLLLTPGALEMRLEWSVPWSLDGGQRVWAAAAHAACVFITLYLIGALWTVHMRSGWRRRENLVGGHLLLTAFALLSASGLGLYYLGDETLGRYALLAHLGAGLLMPPFLLGHVLGGRRARAQAWPRACVQMGKCLNPPKPDRSTAPGARPHSPTG